MRARALRSGLLLLAALALSGCLPIPEPPPEATAQSKVSAEVETWEVTFIDPPPPPPRRQEPAKPPFQFEDGRGPSGTCGTGSDAGCSAPVAEGGDLADKAMPAEPDRRCSTDADCVVKNVGNCCGYYPACVNAQAPTFPEQVKAACEAQGLSSICGFQDITACACIEGRCEAAPGGGELK
ncbi:hypothetical protein SAMN04488509_102110 [Aquimonas voraii]|uniref:Secreted protein n=1 Tax=Aquimonas voraii TaxID=265719 RepID=A0A1G6U3A0_9GAMM|nr:hypothetical protein SAMN04488509_102110 [Aquimonas voraii]